MTAVTFLLSKDPTVDHGGDIALSRLIMRLAAESMTVDAVCLSKDASPSPDPTVARVSKPEVNLARLAVRSLLTGRSVVHTRFDVSAMTDAIDALEPDVFAAEHNYMVEPFLRSRHAGSTPLVLNTVNSESQVWAATRGFAGRLETPRIIRDEVRTARVARAVATYDSGERDFYRSRGVERVHWLDITLPPAARSPVSTSPPRLAFMGERGWPPNQEAFELLARWWPEIAHGIPGAELIVLGNRSPIASPIELPEGMTDIGFALDLDETLGSCRALVAPIQTGGGVRVKLLDAASRGLPVVGTSTAVGAHAPVFGIDTVDDRASFVDRCREYLLSRQTAAAEGDRLFAVNADRWRERVPHSRVADWLAA